MKVRSIMAAVPLLFAASTLMPTLAFAVVQVGGLVGAAPLTVIISESTGQVLVNVEGLGLAPVSPIGTSTDGVPLYSCGIFVVAGDIYFTEPPENSVLSDMIRIYETSGGLGSTFSVWSDASDADLGDPDPFDHAFPVVTGGPSASVTETDPYVVTNENGTATWVFQSDTDVPEPASLGFLGLGTLALINRRRKA